MKIRTQPKWEFKLSSELLRCSGVIRIISGILVPYNSPATRREFRRSIVTKFLSPRRWEMLEVSLIKKRRYGNWNLCKIFLFLISVFVLMNERSSKNFTRVVLKIFYDYTSTFLYTRCVGKTFSKQSKQRALNWKETSRIDLLTRTFILIVSVRGRSWSKCKIKWKNFLRLVSDLKHEIVQNVIILTDLCQEFICLCQ